MRLGNEARPIGVPSGRGFEVPGVTASDRRIIDAAFSNPLEIDPRWKGWLEAYIEPLILDRIAARLSSDIPSSSFPAWQDYTPALTGSVTNPTLGTGAVRTGRWVRIGNTVLGKAEVLFGSAGAAAGSGDYLVNLPVTAAAFAGNLVLGEGWVYDSNLTNVHRVVSEMSDTDHAFFRIASGSGAAVVTHAVPFAWAASDAITFSFMYEAA